MRTASSRQRELSPVWSVDLGEAVSALAWSPEGTMVAAGSLGGRAIVLATGDGEGRDLEGHPDGVLCAAWSADGSWLAIGGQDASVTLSERSGLTTRVAVRGWVSDLAWSPHGDRLAVAAGTDVTVMGTDLATLAEHPFLAGTVNAVAWIGGSPYLAAATLGAIHWFDLTDPRGAPHRTGKVVGAALSLAASPDGSRLASGHLNGSLTLWEMATDKAVVLPGYNGGVGRLSWRHDGRQLAVAAHEELDVWQLDEHGALVEGALPLAETDGTVQGLAFHPTRPILASGGLEGELTLWEPGAAQPVLSTTGIGEEITALDWAPGGGALVVGTITGRVACLELG